GIEALVGHRLALEAATLEHDRVAALADPREELADQRRLAVTAATADVHRDLPTHARSPPADLTKRRREDPELDVATKERRPTGAEAAVAAPRNPRKIGVAVVFTIEHRRD